MCKWTHTVQTHVGQESTVFTYTHIQGSGEFGGFSVSFLNVLEVALHSTVPKSTPQASRPVFLD